MRLQRADLKICLNFQISLCVYFIVSANAKLLFSCVSYLLNCAEPVLSLTVLVTRIVAHVD
jgi:hypothetical protein